MADAIVDLIHQQWHADFQSRAALLGYLRSHAEDLRLGDGYADFIIRLHSPSFDGMCFADVHGHEFHFVTVPPLEVFQDPKLGSEGPSGEASKNQHHGLLAAV